MIVLCGTLSLRMLTVCATRRRAPDVSNHLPALPLARVQDEAEKAFQAWSAKKGQQRQKEEAERLAMVKVRVSNANATQPSVTYRNTAQHTGYLDTM